MMLMNLRSAPSGALFVGENEGDTVLWDAAARKWKVGPGGGGGGVSSWNSRTGAVTPSTGDYDSDQILNSSTVEGFSVSDALDTLAESVAGISTDDVINNSMVSGASTTDALNELLSMIAAPSFEPIQQTWWVDNVSPGGDGSIANPLGFTVDEVWPLITGRSGASTIRLCQELLSVGDALPSMPGGASVIFVGITGNPGASTGMTGLIIGSQAALTVEFRDMTCDSLDMPGTGSVDVRINNATASNWTLAATNTGSMLAQGSDLQITSATGYPLKMYGGTLRGGFFQSAELHDVEVPNGSALQLSAGETSRFYDVKFGTSVTIDLHGGGAVLELDPSSWQSLVSKGVVVSNGTVSLRPAIPQFTQFNIDSVNIAGSSVATIVLGTLTPAAKPSGQVICSFVGAPSPNFVVVGASLNGSGSLVVDVRNLALTTQACTETVQAIYELLGAP